VRLGWTVLVAATWDSRCVMSWLRPPFTTVGNGEVAYPRWGGWTFDHGADMAGSGATRLQGLRREAGPGMTVTADRVAPSVVRVDLWRCRWRNRCRWGRAWCRFDVVLITAVGVPDQCED
jgi:hypothetical protein